jgi:hypothetical protein
MDKAALKAKFETEVAELNEEVDRLKLMSAKFNKLNEEV